MSFVLKKGQTLPKGDVKSELYRIRLNRGNARCFFRLLQDADVVEVRGKIIRVKRDFVIDW